MLRLRLLHLSDFHFTTSWYSLSEPAVPEIVEVVAYLAHRWRRGLDVIIISGDLADTGQSAALERAGQFVYSPAGPPSRPWLCEGHRPTIGAAGVPIILLPGNHDRYHGQFGRPGCRRFDSVFSRHWSAGLQGVQSCFLPDDENSQLAIICADLSLIRRQDASAPGGHWGQGRVYKRSLRELRRLTRLALTSDPPAAVVWMVHFAPEYKYEDGSSLKETLRLVNADALVRAAENLGVQRIFCGHTHCSCLPYCPASAPSVRVHCSGSACCEDSDGRPSIHVVDIDVEGGTIAGVKQLDYFWEKRARTFLPGHNE